MRDVSRETIERILPPTARPEQLQRYHDILALDGVARGLIGPREAPRLWDRHIGNAAWVVLPGTGLVPEGASVADVGSGAGLPGLVWAIVRPDLLVTLIEPLLRRATFLEEVVTELGLAPRVHVVRDRAENLIGTCSWEIVTARAVAPLNRLLSWTVPLLEPDGRLLALKGASAEQEIEQAAAELALLGAQPPVIAERGVGVASFPTRVVIVQRTSEAGHDVSRET